eukprot:16689-Heterococcus_DN1.PRE.14
MASGLEYISIHHNTTCYRSATAVWQQVAHIRDTICHDLNQSSSMLASILAAHAAHYVRTVWYTGKCAL